MVGRSTFDRPPYLAARSEISPHEFVNLVEESSQKKGAGEITLCMLPLLSRLLGMFDVKSFRHMMFLHLTFQGCFSSYILNLMLPCCHHDSSSEWEIKQDKVMLSCGLSFHKPSWWSCCLQQTQLICNPLVLRGSQKSMHILSATITISLIILTVINCLFLKIFLIGIS